MKDDPRLGAMELRANAAEARVLALEAALAETLLAHEQKARDFHHGVKNSLQVVQSYLALARRHRLPAERNLHLAEAEAKVLVISGAYRLALSEGTLAPLALDAFLQQVMAGAFGLLCPFGQEVMLTGASPQRLGLETAIPLGLALVDVVLAAQQAGGCPHVHVAAEGSCVLLRVSAPDLEAPIALPVRLMAGLKAQIRAQAEPLQAGDILSWRIAVMAGAGA